MLHNCLELVEYGNSDLEIFLMAWFSKSIPSFSGTVRNHCSNLVMLWGLRQWGYRRWERLRLGSICLFRSGHCTWLKSFQAKFWIWMMVFNHALISSLVVVFIEQNRVICDILLSLHTLWLTCVGQNSFTIDNTANSTN